MSTDILTLPEGNLAFVYPEGTRLNAVGDPLFTPESDIVTCCVIAFVFTVARFISEITVFSWIADAFGVKNSDDKKPRKKLAEAGWKLLVWIFLFVMGLSICRSKPWFFNGVAMWTHFPTPLEPDVKLYYLIEFGWYIHSQVYLMFLEKSTGQKRSDFMAMTIHHITTMSLIYLSYTRGYSPIGCMTMWVHDVVDIFLESALFMKELKFDKLVDLLFGLFAASWVVFRLYIFPFYLVYSVWFDSYAVDGCPRNPLNTVEVTSAFQHIALALSATPNNCQGMPILSVGFVVLCVLHAYWFTLILKMIVRAIRKKGVEADIRDDAETKKTK